MSIERAIICDGCGRLIAASHTSTKARADVRAMGGRTELPGGRDYCGGCVEFGAHKSADVENRRDGDGRTH
jgi:hypothetical protein